MPSLQDRLTHAKDLAEWKVGQGKRIMDMQGKINDFEKQVQRSKQLLSDSTYTLHTQNKLQDEELRALCVDIDSIYSAIERSKGELEGIKNEEAPELIDSSKMVFTGLVCPVCGKKLAGKFCPIDGVEGIRIAPPTTPSVAAAVSGRICPQCHKPVVDKFCVDCGIEGVDAAKQKAKPIEKQNMPPVIAPVSKTQKPKQTGITVETTPKKSSSTKTELVCPKCGKDLKMKFCNDCGVAGVPKTKATKTPSVKKAKTPPTEKTAAKQKKAAPSKSETTKTELVCPKCKKVLNMKFCNDCGVEGVPKPLTATKTEKTPTSKSTAAKKTTPKSTSAKKSSTKKEE